MGVVYEAEQISLDRQVALKMLPFAGMLDPKQLKRFKNEARAAASLDHPNIVHVLSIGCERNVHYYVMQYIEGHTLSQVINELRRLSNSDAPHDPADAVGRLSRDLTSGQLLRLTTKSGPEEATAEPVPSTAKPASAETQRQPQAAKLMEESLRLVTQASAADRDNLRLRRRVVKHHLCLGCAYGENKNTDLASDCLRKAIQLGEQFLEEFPEDPKQQAVQILSLAELSAVASSDTEREPLIREAINRAETLLDEHPSMADARFGLAFCYEKLAIQMIQSKQFDEAIEASRVSIRAYEQLAKQFPDVLGCRQYLVGVHLNLSISLLLAGKLDDAEAEARESVALAKSLVKDRTNTPSYRRLLANALRDHGWRLQSLNRLSEASDRFREAIAELERLVQLDKLDRQALCDSADTRIILADLLLSIDDLDAAQEEVQRAMETYHTLTSGNSDGVFPRKRLGRAYERLAKISREKGDLDATLAYLDKLIAVYPLPAPVAYGRKGIVFLLRREYDQACRAFTKAKELSPDFAGAYNGLGDVYYHQQKYEEALAEFSKFIELQPEDRWGWHNRACTYLRMGRYQEALSDNGRALKLRPNSGSVYGSLGATHYRLGQYEEARVALLRVFEHTKDERKRPEALLFLAMTDFRLGRREEALEWFAKGIAAIDENADSHLKALRDEAAGLLGVSDDLETPEDSTPPDEKEPTQTEVTAKSG